MRMVKYQVIKDICAEKQQNGIFIHLILFNPLDKSPQSSCYSSRFIEQKSRGSLELSNLLKVTHLIEPILHLVSVAWDWVPTTAAPRSKEEALAEGWDVLGVGL